MVTGGHVDELEQRVREQLRRVSDETWKDAAAVSDYNLTEGHKWAVFQDLMIKAERVDAALRAGGWYCPLGHKHKLTEVYCERMNAIIETAAKG